MDIKNKSDVDLLTEDEKKEILCGFNDTKTDYPKHKTIYELFEEQVEKTPENIAVVYEEKELSYRELNKRANQLAKVLREKGVGPDKIVGIMVERSLEMIIGIMAILKAGGAYLPIDPSYPKSRIEYILRDSKSNILLTMESLLGDIEFSGEVIDLLDKGLFKGEVSNLKKINSPNDLIYVIFTSGTTGNPKGIMVKHQSFTNLIQWYYSEFKMSEKDNILLMASISFDLAQKNIYAPLVVGGKLTLANKGMISYKKVNKIINENKITIINCAPSMFNPIIEFNKETNYVELKSLKHIFLGGESINLKQLNDWMNSKECSCKIVNTYGPTECTDIATFYRIKKEDISPVPIGKPINNAKLYILDKDKKLVPVGVQGELYIAGDGVSRGYLNKPELTDEKFVENPFKLGTKMYKTGDLARWTLDGNIEFLGRIDNQVKIRGFRIELEEIENRLLQHKDIKEVAVVARENKENEKYICAYVICREEVNKLNLAGYLKQSIPEYMVPNYFVQLEKMPLTVNGKIDRRAFPEPNLDANLNEYEAPKNKLEEKLAKIWREVLGIEKVGINDNFFENGGNSILAIKLEIEMEKENIPITVIDLYEYQTIEEIASFIDKSNVKKDKLMNSEIEQDTEYKEVIVNDSKKILHGFEAFNDIFYKDCFFNSLFPIVRYFKKSPLYFLVNDIMMYDFETTSNGFLLNKKILSLKNKIEVLKDLGINIESKILSNDLIGDIKKSISKARPVIIFVDCFYATIRKDVYDKEHLEHTWCIYGYDDTNQTFNIIEHKNKDNLFYKKTVVNYNDVLNSYFGFLENFQKDDNRTSTYYEFYLSNKDDSSDYVDIEKLCLAKNIIENDKLIQNGLQQLQLFFEAFDNIVSDRNVLEQNASILVDMLNSVINTMYVEQYRMQKIFKNYTQITAMLDDIIKNWNLIRTKIVKFNFTKKYREDFGLLMENLEHIYLQEKILQDNLFKICNQEISRRNSIQF